MHLIEWLLFMYLWVVPAPAFQCECAQRYIGMVSKGKGYKWLGSSHSEECLPWVEWLKKRIRSELLTIAQFQGTIKQLNVEYPMECVREMNGIYRVSYLGQSKIATIIFDEKGNILVGNVYDTVKRNSDFEDLLIGQSLDEVKKLTLMVDTCSFIQVKIILEFLPIIL